MVGDARNFCLSNGGSVSFSCVYNHMKKCPYFWKVQWGVLRVKFPIGQTKSKSFEGEVWLKHFQCAVCAEFRVGLKFQQIYYWCSLCRCLGENWFIVRCQVSLDKKSNGKLKCACGMGVGLVTHKFPICGLLSTRVPPVHGWRRWRRQRVGSRRRWQSHCSIDLHAGRWLASPIAGWLW